MASSSTRGSTVPRPAAGRIRTRRRASIGLGLVGVALVGVALWRALGPPAPDTVCRRALAAVDRRDARELLGLADPEELRRLNLNEASVNVLLSETFWQHGPPRVAGSRIERGGPEPADRASFAVYGPASAPERPAFFVSATDSQDIGWRLDLSWLFYSCCRHQAALESAGRMDYARLCRKAGVLGMKDSRSQYHDVAQIEAKAREFAAQGR